MAGSMTFVGCNEILGPTAQRQSLPVPTDQGDAAVANIPAPSGDLNRDGRVDASDLSYFAWVMSADVNGDAIVSARDAEVISGVITYVQTGSLGDLTGDGVVDASDISMLARARGRSDLNHSGAVDASDLSLYAFLRSRGDVDRDGAVSSADAGVIRRQLGEVLPS
jgi:hypothetical protein